MSTIGFWISGVVGRTLAYSVPLLLSTLGEIYAERSGVLNLGVEGLMSLGAFSAFAVAFFSGNPWLGVVVSGIVAGCASLVHAFCSVTLRTNQVVSGLALGMLGMGISGVLGRNFEGKVLATTLPVFRLPFLSALPGFEKHNVFVYASLGLAVILWFVLFHTRWGIVIRSVGENPAACDAMGINVTLVRYACVFFGGVLAGLSGAYLSLGYRPSWSYGMTAGIGWLAIALTIFAFWNPLWGMVGAYLFGILYHFSFRFQVQVSPELLNTLPYLFPLVALGFVSRLAARRKVGPPASLGVPYQRGSS
ncbi:ABC transporter permease [Candidatus Caldatribacterium sp. SIUC1]|uniref:ABC transporter permease n=1 Tax=Candidatus Caldatribacterium sp. SIUC1 TaxID=3418365 RepID=UPI003F68D799